ncbi:MAG: 3-phosphoserine/phosphohydroxythreonine transaminase [Enterobacterales bacterium]
MNRIFNFSAGPASLPIEVLKEVQYDLCNWRNLGFSVMEISHRDQKFIEIALSSEKNLRDLLCIPSNYKVLFCQGGARSQFSAIPMNLLGNYKTADYINGGYWMNSAILEAQKYCSPRIINISQTINGIHSVKSIIDWKLSKNSAYIHYCPNETINGLAIHEIPNFNNNYIFVIDCSSVILSSPLNICKFGVIYASAQKNIGPSGLTIVIIREDLINRKKLKFLPSTFNYKIISDNNSMFNTPPTLSWYIAGLVFKWLKNKGGLSTMYKLNKVKSDLLYREIDSNDFYQNNINKKNRSYMNIPFFIKNKKLHSIFIEKAVNAGLYGLKGHSFYGGLRASIYNAMPIEGVKSLITFMQEFRRLYG